MATDNAIRSFTLDVDELGWTGQDLQRPESVVAEPDGTLWASDGRGDAHRPRRLTDAAGRLGR
jgi:gluconolactonase